MAEARGRHAKERGRRRVLAVGVALLLGPAGLAGAAGEAAPAKLPTAHVHFEQNATDGDVEVVFGVKGGDDGLASLTITGPDGRTVVGASSPDASTMGVRQFRSESPEPTDVERIRAAYPEGAYAFTATSTGGARFAGLRKAKGWRSITVSSGAAMRCTAGFRPASCGHSCGMSRRCSRDSA